MRLMGNCSCVVQYSAIAKQHVAFGRAGAAVWMKVLNENIYIENIHSKTLLTRREDMVDRALINSRLVLLETAIRSKECQ